MKSALMLAVLCLPATAASAADGARAERSAATVITPGWTASGSTVRVHRGRGAPAAVPVPVARPAAGPKVVVIVRRPRGVFSTPYPRRDWTAERFGQSDWSGRSFGSGDFGRGPWGDYGP